MTERIATCVCGELSVVASCEPVKISACHCRACQRRTGSAFSVAVFFPRDRVVPAGMARTYSRRGDSGLSVEFSFCPQCGSTVWWHPEFRPGWIGVALGCFDDPALVPDQAVYDRYRRNWVKLAIPQGSTWS